MRNDSRINSPGTNKAAQGGDGSFIGWSSPSKPMKCPLPDCTCVIRPDEWEEHLQLHEIESALVCLILLFSLFSIHISLCNFEFAFSLHLPSHRLRRNLTQRQGEKERHDKREANDFDLLQRYNGGLLEEAEMYSPVDSPSLSAPSPTQSSSVQKGAYVKQYIRSLERYYLCPSFYFSPHLSWLIVLLSLSFSSHALQRLWCAPSVARGSLQEEGQAHAAHARTRHRDVDPWYRFSTTCCTCIPP